MNLNKEKHKRYSTFFEVPERDTLRALMRYGSSEEDCFEFKGQWLEEAELARHILAFANSGGGALVFGVKEKPQNLLKSKGLFELKNVAHLKVRLKQYIPSTIEWEVLDFDFKGSECSAISGKRFQVLRVVYNRSIVPLMALRKGSGLKSDVVYVRDGSISKPAGHEQLQKILDERIGRRTIPASTMELAKHLTDLKLLYNQIPSLPSEKLTEGTGLTGETPLGKYTIFVSECIEIKKKQIREFLRSDVD